MNLITAAVSAVAGAGCLAGWTATWIFGGKTVPRASLLLLVAGTTGLLSTALVSPVRWVMDQLDHWLTAAAVNYAVAGVVGVAWATVVAYVGVRFYQRRIDDRVMGIAAALPIIVPFIPGRLGAITTAVVYGPANFIGWAVGQLFGLI